MVLCDLSANGRNGFVWILMFGCKTFNQLYIYYYNDKNIKLHFALRHYVHVCRNIAIYELHKKFVRRCSEGTNSHPIKYYNLRL